MTIKYQVYLKNMFNIEIKPWNDYSDIIKKTKLITKIKIMGDEVYYFEPQQELKAEEVNKLKQKVDEAEKNAVNYIIAIIAAFAATGMLYGVLDLLGIY